MGAAKDSRGGGWFEEDEEDDGRATGGALVGIKIRRRLVRWRFPLLELRLKGWFCCLPG